MILFLHNRYRTTGGEERVVEELRSLVSERLGEPTELVQRDSARLSRRGAAIGLLRGGIEPRDVAGAVRLTGARVLHAHNLNPAFGWRALAAARTAGARVVLHLHQYRLVCANGVCFTRGEDCTRCHGRNTLPGVVHGCRGARAESIAYGAALALWQRRVAQLADAVIVPSEFARERLRELGAPLDFGRVHVLPPPIAVSTRAALDSASTDAAPASTAFDSASAAPASASTDEALVDDGRYALVVARLAVEKGVDVAIDACRLARVPLVIAGDGPEREALRARAGTGDVRFVGRVSEQELRRLRAGAAVALVPSRSAETFGMAAAEAMAAGLPVAASRVGALADLVEPDGLVPPGDPAALAEVLGRRWDDAAAGERGRLCVQETCAPPVVAERLAQVYERACA